MAASPRFLKWAMFPTCAVLLVPPPPKRSAGSPAFGLARLDRDGQPKRPDDRRVRSLPVAESAAANDSVLSLNGSLERGGECRGACGKQAAGELVFYRPLGLASGRLLNLLVNRPIRSEHGSR
jgi:hypothetical protein